MLSPGIALTMLIVAACVAGCRASAAAVDSQWNCTTMSRDVVGPGTAIEWWQANCTGTTPVGAVGPIVVNVLRANLSDPSLVVTTLHANTTRGVETLPQMMAQDSRLVAGVNGGYFFRVDLRDFFDDVCFGKVKAEAIQPVSPLHPNHGIGDGLIVKDGTLIASNCNTSYGYNRPTTLVLDGAKSNIIIQTSGAPAPAGVKNALAAGPNLVSYHVANRTAFVNIPKDDENVNIFEHAANTAVGLVGTPGAFTELAMVTFNGADNCLFDPRCGINSRALAYFMKDHIGVSQAMNMDQGGSTTMVVKGHGNSEDIVSCSSVPGCGGGGRLLYSGLFVGYR